MNVKRLSLIASAVMTAMLCLIAVCIHAKTPEKVSKGLSINGVFPGMDESSAKSAMSRRGFKAIPRDSDEILFVKVTDERLKLKVNSGKIIEIGRNGEDARHPRNLEVSNPNGKEPILIEIGMTENKAIEKLGQPETRASNELLFQIKLVHGVRAVFSDGLVKFAEGHEIEDDGNIIYDQWSTLDDITAYFGKSIGPKDSSQDFLYRRGLFLLSVACSNDKIELISLSQEKDANEGRPRVQIRNPFSDPTR